MPNSFDILNKKYSSYYDEEPEPNNVNNTLRQHDDLFDDKDYIVHKIIRIRRKNTPRKGEYWEILEDNKVMLEVKEYRLTKSQKEFLRTSDGIKLVMQLYKDGNRSVSKIIEGIELKIK